MATNENPALKQLLAILTGELTFGQVLIKRSEAGSYELRHIANWNAAVDTLRRIRPGEARHLAQFTAANEFRPLKSAPTLATGWVISASGDQQLETALNGLYPGALADWFASGQEHPPVTGFRDYVNRQTGMYRPAAKLTDVQAAVVIQAGCDASCCLKRRLWSVGGLAPDAPETKSLIPCLEPCAILLEMARVAGKNAAKIGGN